MRWRAFAGSIALVLGATGCLFPDYRVVGDPNDPIPVDGGRGGSGARPDATSAPEDAGRGGMDGSGGREGAAAEAGPAQDGSPAERDGDVPVRESCTSGEDDDGDGRIDCFDDDCAEDPACAGMCSDAAELPCNVTRTAQSTDAPGSTSRIGPPDYSCAGGPRPGPEYAYRFTGAADQDVFLKAYALSSDVGLFLVEVDAGGQCDAAGACIAAADARADTRPEALAFAPVEGRDYYVVVDGPEPAGYALSVACAPPGGCRPARAIEAGQTLQGSNALGQPNVTSVNATYSCVSGTHSAPEAAFIFTPVQSGSYEVNLTNLSANANLIVLLGPECDTTCLDASSYSANPSTQPESVVFDATAHTTYYIVVDGFSTVTFELSVQRL